MGWLRKQAVYPAHVRNEWIFINRHWLIYIVMLESIRGEMLLSEFELSKQGFIFSKDFIKKQDL